MSFEIETVSEEGQEDYEVWTCTDCGKKYVLSGVGGDLSDCSNCLKKEMDYEMKQEKIDEARQSQENSFFDDWLRDNKETLMKEFIEEEYDAFFDYAKECFRTETGRKCM